MSRLVIVLLCASVVWSAELPSSQNDGSAREEKLRTGLINAFQNIKQGSAKGRYDEEGTLNDDLVGSLLSHPRPAQDDKFELFADDDGLSFADFGHSDPDVARSTTETAHNVQHIVKTAKTEKPTSKPKDNNILSKLSDSIRNTVNESRGVLKRESVNVTDIMGIENMMRIFDADILVTQWNEIQRNLTGECRDHMQEYVNALLERKLWALKMEDASGRYTSMFYWGNNYWTGSAELCDALNENHGPAKARNKSSGSQIFSEWRADVSMSGSNPPFDTAFYTVRVSVTTDVPEIVRTRRTLYLGLCLPWSCGRRAVGAVVGAARAPLLHHAVLAVRSPQHGGYTYIQDTTFQVLLGMSLVVACLLVSATVYDVRLSRAVRRRRRRAANMAAAAPTRVHCDLKLQMNTLDDIDIATANGKAAMYNVNNNIQQLNTNNSAERLTGETSSTTTSTSTSSSTVGEDELKLSVWSELLLSFSMKANVVQIFEQSVGADTVPVVHGLRSLSMVWVIFGHTCIVVFKYADNTALRAILEKSFWFQLIISAVYSVDTFFCLGGMLVAFLYFRTNAKGKLDLLTKGRKKITAGVLQFLGLMGYRFARLTVPYLFMLGVVEVTMKWFAHNAVFEPPANDDETCPQYWWRNLLYINTLFPVEQMCMLWSWYLSDDTQFYAVSAILLILSTSHFKLSAILSVLFFISSLLTTGYVSWSNDHVPNSEDPFTQFDKIYDKPWTRLGPYLVGMFTGWLLFKTDLKIKMNRMWAIVGWTVCAGVLLFLIFGLYDTELSVGASAVYSALSHSLWAAAIGWIIIACSTGHGGWVREILAAPILYPFSRLTYCTYLVHPVVLRYVAMHLTHPIHLGELLVFVLFLGLTVISFFLALVISVSFEAPMVSMLKILAPQRKPHRV